MDIDYKYLHDALDRVEHTTTVDFFHYQFQTVQSLLAFVHPEIPEYYYASRFAYGLQADYQNFISRFQPTTILAAYQLALIYEESLYLDYFPEIELIADENVVQDHVCINIVEEIATRSVENSLEVNNVECVEDSNVCMIKADNKSDPGEKEAIKSLGHVPSVQQMVSHFGGHQHVIPFREEVIDQSSLLGVQRNELIKYITLLQYIFCGTCEISLLTKIGIGNCKFKGISVVFEHDKDNSSFVTVTSGNLVVLRDLAFQVERGDVENQHSKEGEVLANSSFCWEPGSNRLCYGTLVSAHRTKEVNQWVVAFILDSQVYRDNKELLQGFSRSDIYVELTLFDPGIIYTMMGMLKFVFDAKPSNPKLVHSANNGAIFSFIFLGPMLVTSASIYSYMSSSLAFQCCVTTSSLDIVIHNAERVTDKQLVWFSVQILTPQNCKYVPLSAFIGAICNSSQTVTIQLRLADNLASRHYRIFRDLKEGLVQLFTQHQWANSTGKELSSFSSLSQFPVLSYQSLLREGAAAILGSASARSRVVPWTHCHLKYEFPLLSSTLNLYHVILKLGGPIWHGNIEWTLHHNFHINVVPCLTFIPFEIYKRVQTKFSVTKIQCTIPGWVTIPTHSLYWGTNVLLWQGTGHGSCADKKKTSLNSTLWPKELEQFLQSLSGSLYDSSPRAERFCVPLEATSHPILEWTDKVKGMQKQDLTDGLGGSDRLILVEITQVYGYLLACKSINIMAAFSLRFFDPGIAYIICLVDYISEFDCLGDMEWLNSEKFSVIGKYAYGCSHLCPSQKLNASRPTVRVTNITFYDSKESADVYSTNLRDHLLASWLTGIVFHPAGALISALNSMVTKVLNKTTFLALLLQTYPTRYILFPSSALNLEMAWHQCWTLLTAPLMGIKSHPNTLLVLIRSCTRNEFPWPISNVANWMEDYQLFKRLEYQVLSAYDLQQYESTRKRYRWQWWPEKQLAADRICALWNIYLLAFTSILIMLLYLLGHKCRCGLSHILIYDKGSFKCSTPSSVCILLEVVILMEERAFYTNSVNQLCFLWWDFMDLPVKKNGSSWLNIDYDMNKTKPLGVGRVVV